MAQGLPTMSIKSVQVDIFQKCIIQPKKFEKGRQAWEQACIDFRLKPKKLNTVVKTRHVSCPFFIKKLLNFFVCILFFFFSFICFCVFVLSCILNL